MSSMVQSARPLAMPHSSLASRGRSGAARSITASGERKEHVLQTTRSQSSLCTKLLKRTHTTHRTVSQQHKAVADALGIGQLMDCQYERAAACRHAANESHDLARLPEIEAVEWLVHEQQRLRCEQRERQHQSPAVA